MFLHPTVLSSLVSACFRFGNKATSDMSTHDMHRCDVGAKPDGRIFERCDCSPLAPTHTPIADQQSRAG